MLDNLRFTFWNNVSSFLLWVCNTLDDKTPMISLLNNSEKLVQILLDFSQQIVQGYEFVLTKFR